MLFSSRLPTSTIIQVCRVLRHNLSAGLMLREIFRQQARRGPPNFRPVARHISEAIERGDSLKTALQLEKHRFPPLFLALAGVGEHTGNLPEIFGELENYYIMQQKFVRQFVTQSMMPVLQFLAAVFVIAGMMYILGLIAESTNTKPLDPLGVGLTGSRGAAIFLFIVFGSIGGLIAFYVLVSRQLQQKAVVDRFLLRIPAVGPFLRALAMSRLTMAMHLTLDTSTPIGEAMDLSLRATGNSAFATLSPGFQETLLSGDTMYQAFSRAGLFPEEFLSVVAVGEESGRLPEVMGQQAEVFEEEAGRRLAILTRAAGFGVWLFVAILIIVAIFRIFMLYLAAINQNL
jgi:type IV pilus assembly protein PilC